MKKWGKRLLFKKLILPILTSSVVVTAFIIFISVIGMMFMVTGNNNSDCGGGSDSDTEFQSEGDGSAVPGSVDEFVKAHKNAYILSWKAGGFLPSASIAQTMVENGFNFTNPSGTSLWQAHNMGGGTTRFSISVEIAK